MLRCNSLFSKNAVFGFFNSSSHGKTAPAQLHAHLHRNWSTNSCQKNCGDVHRVADTPPTPQRVSNDLRTAELGTYSPSVWHSIRIHGHTTCFLCHWLHLIAIRFKTFEQEAEIYGNFYSTFKNGTDKYSHFPFYKPVDCLYSLNLFFLVNNRKIYIPFDNLFNHTLKCFR